MNFTIGTAPKLERRFWPKNHRESTGGADMPQTPFMRPFPISIWGRASFGGTLCVSGSGLSGKETEMTWKETLEKIQAGEETARAQALRRWDSLAKPLGSLGILEEAIVRIAALTGTAEVCLKNRALVVLCADNGVVSQGVSQSDASVTRAVTAALGNQSSTVNYMAQKVNCQVVPVDLGVLDFLGAPGVKNCRVRNGTGDISQGPAMTRAQCIQAIETGISLAQEAKETGASILLTGEMGIGNTTTSCAVASVLLGRDPGQLAGRGSGLSEEGFRRKVRAIRQAICRNAPDPGDPISVLQTVGGLDLAGLCGLCLGGAYVRLPVLLDGLIADVAALCAVRLRPQAADALLAGHVSAEPGAQWVLQALGLRGMIQAEMRLGEGTGAVAALPLLDLALAVYQSGHTFAQLGIEAYTPQ